MTPPTGGRTRREVERAVDGPFDVQASLRLDELLQADEEVERVRSEEVRMDNSIGVSAMLMEALTCAGHGWRVHPVKGKVPLVKDWPSLASTDETTITEWWAQFPAANIGLATGKQSNLFVVDVDPGKGGNESLRGLEEKFGELPQTIEVLTGGGGHHYYFQYPGNGIGNSASQLGPGLDIKTDGGQVVAPPSVHPTTKRTYEWEAGHHPDDVPLAPVPPWLLALLTSTTEPGAPFLAPPVIGDGARNTTLYREARSLKAKGFSREAMVAAIRAENTAKCTPPLPEREIEAIVDSAWSQADRPAFAAKSPPPPSDTSENSFQAYRPGGLPETSFRPVRASDLLDEVQEPTTWLLEDYLPLGSLALLAGKPKEGKTTLVYELAVKVAQGLPFLGRTTQQGGVLILAVEEHRRDVKLRLQNLGAEGLDDLYVHVGALSPTPTLFAHFSTFIHDHNIRLVLVDTLAAFWHVQNENDASEMTKGVKPLLQLARESEACVFLVHHARKSEGSHGDEIRGSGALFGLVDVAIVMKRHSVETQRLLQAQSRYPETPSELVVELREHGYESLGDPAKVGKADKLRRLREALTEKPEATPVLAKKAGLSRRDATKLLSLLLDNGETIREGKGKRNDPYRFRHFVSGTPPSLIASNDIVPTEGQTVSFLAPPHASVPPARHETGEEEFIDAD